MIIGLSPSPPLSECVSGLLDRSLQMFPASATEVGVATPQMHRVLLPLVVMQLHKAFHPGAMLAASAYRWVLLDWTTPHFLIHSPERMGVSFIPTSFQKRQLTEPYKAQVFYLQETLKSNLIWCLQFASRETQSQKGSECSLHHI